MKSSFRVIIFVATLSLLFVWVENNGHLLAGNSTVFEMQFHVAPLSMPKDEAQLYAANELYKRGWFYHKEHRLWFIRVPNMEPLVKTNTYERGSYHCFDPSTFETVRKVLSGWVVVVVGVAVQKTLRSI
ncbi:unnamed protein product [Lupinus luteus]|uniref:NOT2/NOT3/NOT5 C-terminal domain-containing protein n=1 Tax=Lupinus luteus TaxID=3873 RepID=A0AAV1XM31_LUPLU